MHYMLVSRILSTLLVLFAIFLPSSIYTVSIREYIQTHGQPTIYSGHLMLISCNITSLDGFEEIKDPLNVTSLWLDHNLLEHIPENAFAIFSNLHSLSLTNNTITTLSEYAFWGIPSLTNLNLYKNRLSTIAETVFYPLPLLEHLDLRHNRLQELQSATFRPLCHTLKWLYLSHNSLYLLPSDLFAGLFHLQTLFLNHNSLIKLDITLFNDLVQLKELDISGNKLEYINPALFTNTHNLESLTFSNNSLSYIFCQDQIAHLTKLNNFQP
jgi:Leucine-rich repeat (LRR) protein